MSVQIQSTPVCELAELLERHGVSVSQSGGSARWRSGGRDWVATNAWPVNDPSGSTVILHVKGMTPEEVVALCQSAEDPRVTEATTYLPEWSGYTWSDEDGVEHEEDDSAHEYAEDGFCDRCGYVMVSGDCGWFDHTGELRQYTDEDGNLHRGYYWKPKFNYCPWCGRRVTYEDRGYEPFKWDAEWA